LLELAGRESDDSMSKEKVQGILDALEDEGLLVRSGQTYLNLATSWEDSTALVGAAPRAQR
jgi:hypothetical protein